ncbi:hypothetical protein [Pseudonocardia sp. NPDC049635]|uniref:hypothetical protein n=1 Tax=Pseudonocardia sp. NPDC049635 TaxID=3155506 RepID=UPI0033FBECB8
MSDQPRTYVPLDSEGRPDPGRVQVELYQHRPGQTDALVAWSKGRRLVVNGMPAVVLPNGDPVGLGDYALRFPNTGRLRLEPADGLATRYQLAEQED